MGVRQDFILPDHFNRLPEIYVIRVEAPYSLLHLEPLGQ